MENNKTGGWSFRQFAGIVLISSVIGEIFGRAFGFLLNIIFTPGKVGLMKDAERFYREHGALCPHCGMWVPYVFQCMCCGEIIEEVLIGKAKRKYGENEYDDLHMRVT